MTLINEVDWDSMRGDSLNADHTGDDRLRNEAIKFNTV